MNDHECKAILQANVQEALDAGLPADTVANILYSLTQAVNRGELQAAAAQDGGAPPIEPPKDPVVEHVAEPDDTDI